jgi:hypothetical protein
MGHAINPKHKNRRILFIFSRTGINTPMGFLSKNKINIFSDPK